MSHYKSYPKYKDSTIYWAKKVPENWEIAVTGRALEPKNHNVGSLWRSTPLLSLTQKGVVNRDINNLTGKTHSDYSTYQIVEKHDLIFCLFDIDETPRTVGLANSSGMITSAYNVFTARESANRVFLYFFFEFIDNCKGLKPFYTGMRKTVRPPEFLKIKIPLPPRVEQNLISEHLATETTRIDALIEKKTRFIELLKEKRQALITEAVTKGLDPSVKMKDSGIEWLGEVPEHWKVMALKRLVSCPITDGPHETPQRHNNGVPFVSAEAIKNGVLDFNRIWGYISVEDNVRYSKKYRPKKNDIYMVKSGATTGATAIVNDNVDFNIWSPLAAIRPNSQVLPNFLLAAIRSTFFQDGIALNWSYGTQQNIGMKTLSNLPVFVPPKEEQSMLMQKVGALVEKHDQLINKSQISIELLKERRAALITAAVTGQIDLRDAA